MRHTEEKVGNLQTRDNGKSEGDGEHETPLPDQDHGELEPASDPEGWRAVPTIRLTVHQAFCRMSA